MNGHHKDLNPVQIACMIVIIGIVLIGIFAPLIIPNDPYYVDVSKKLLSPSFEYPLGTDHLGRCIFSRILLGIRYSMGAAIIVLLCVVTIGLLVGTFVALKGAWIDYLFIRICDILLAFPTIVLAFALVGILGPSLFNLIIALILSQWIYYARIVRNLVLTIKEKDFILAAKVNGTKGTRIMRMHFFPHMLKPLMILVTLDIGSVLLQIAGFSFLGLGVQAPTPEWGMMINEGRNYLRQSPELIIYPGIAIIIVVAGFNLLGESFKDACENRGGTHE